MAKNFIQPGEAIDLVASGPVAGGDLVTVGALVGIAVRDAVSGDTYSINTKGVYTIPKTAPALAVGEKVMVADTPASVGGSVLSDDNSGVPVGVVVEAAVLDSTEVKVRLHGS
jgi:predicted RecA/RadA family phage recombinase